MAIETIKARIVEEAKRIENDTLYSAKGHYEAANYWKNFHIVIGVPVAMLSAVAGASALAQFDNHSIIAGFLSIIVAALTAVITFLNPNEKASSHQNVGNKYNALRNKARAFYTIDACVENSEQELMKRLQDLTKQRDEINQISLPIPYRAYKKAQRTITGKETAKSKHFAHSEV